MDKTTLNFQATYVQGRLRRISKSDFYKLIIIPTKSHQTYLLAYEKETKNVFNKIFHCYVNF